MAAHGKGRLARIATEEAGEPGGSLDGAAEYAAEYGDIFSQLLALEPKLPKAQRAVARAILSQPQMFVAKPIEDLVAWLGVSAPTIIRFSRALGCEGLRDLKLRTMGGLRVGMRYIEPLTPPGTVSDIVERVVMRSQHSIATAARTMDLAALERAADLIGRSRALYAFGSGGVSSWLVDEIQNRLFRLGLRVIPSADHQMQMMLAATAERADVVIGCSLTGRNTELVKALAVARQYGASTIALTAPGSPLAAAAALPLTIGLTDDRDVLGPTSMRYGFLVTIDVLAYTIGIRHSRVAQETLRRIKQQFVSYRDEDDGQPLSD
jgi:DNA-binding MurR/RpiR family transcriptional regulator